MAQVPFGFEPPENNGPRVLTVSELQRMLRSDLERNFPRIFIEGEISNFHLQRVSGHAYFTLKDQDAQLNCVIWRDMLRITRFRPADGQQVVAVGRLTVFERSGQLQLSVMRLEMRGRGALLEAYRQLAEKLRAEGLTAPERKRPIPVWPRVVGVVTSRDGAALRDVVRTLLRRNPRTQILLASAQVQGEQASGQIAAAIAAIDASARCDVLLVVRGGGSVEDLWAFNEEVVARAVLACRTPVISGVGHETDRTIIDLVADLAASTPTAAAEQAMPEFDALAGQLAAVEQRLLRAIQRRLERARLALGRSEKGLADPRRALMGHAQALDDSIRRLERATKERLGRGKTQLTALEKRLLERHPRTRLALFGRELALAESRLPHAMRRRLGAERLRLDRAERRLGSATRPLEIARGRFDNLVARLEALSPLRVLGRGYALVYDPAGHVLQRAEPALVGQTVTVRLAEGRLAARVEATFPPPEA